MEVEFMFGRPLDLAMELSGVSKESFSEQGDASDCHGARWPGRCRWPSLERVVRTVFAMDRIARAKASKEEPFRPTLFN
jgi:hypothetical protein